MGAGFQTPHATPGQRLMEMHHVSLIVFYFRMLLQQITQVCTKLKLNKYDKRIIIIIIIIITIIMVRVMMKRQ